MWAIQTCRRAKYTALPGQCPNPIQVAARKWDYLTDTLEPMKPVIYAALYKPKTRAANVIKACLLAQIIIMEQ